MQAIVMMGDYIMSNFHHFNSSKRGHHKNVHTKVADDEII